MAENENNKIEGGQVPEIPTKSDTLGVFTAEEKEEQERTVIKKKLFLETWGKTLGSVKATCEKVEISRDTYYEWRNNDPEFKKALERKGEEKLEDVRQALNTLILQLDGPSVRYFLDRRDPDFMPKSKHEVIGGGAKSLKEMDEEFERELKENGLTAIQPNKGDTPIKNSEVLPDKKQEGETGAVHTEQSTAVLLEKKDEKKHNSESSPKRDLKNNRRRPAPRQFTGGR